MSEPTSLGQSWRGDWQQRLAALLADHGAPSATAFAEAHPTATLGELARLLGPEDVAPIQVRWTMLAEATALGPDAIERYARTLLARELRGHSSTGWDQDDHFKGGLFGAWSAALPEDSSPVALAIWGALIAARPANGWVPSGADDPLLVEVFRAHWPKPAAVAP